MAHCAFRVIGIAPDEVFFHHETVARDAADAIDRIVGFYEYVCFPVGTKWVAARITEKPDASNHNADPRYLRGLIDRAGISQRKAAKRLGMSWSGFQRYLRDESDSDYRVADYRVQFALECLAEADKPSS